jgi:hypothetical protein
MSVVFRGGEHRAGVWSVAVRCAFISPGWYARVLLAGSG